MKKQTKPNNPSVTIVGTGYVGLVTAITFTEKGFETTCIDIIPEKIETIMNGKAPFYEADLDRLVEQNIKKGMLTGTTDFSKIRETDLTFICVGTPSNKDGSIDLEYVRTAASRIGKELANKNEYHVVVMKSTVIPGTTEKTLLPILEKESGKKAGEDFGVGMNPEFLREGSALEDSFAPDRIVIGGIDDKTIEKIKELYSGFHAPLVPTNPTTAEMIKYASNSFLAMKISYANEMANICENAGMNVDDVMKGVGLDQRISPLFLRAGVGFGGSCFPKDVKALRTMFRKLGMTSNLLEATLQTNREQPLRVVEILKKELGDLRNKEIAVLGLAFKPDTDDVRETRALPIVLSLLENGAKVKVFDPMAAGNFKKLVKGKENEIKWCGTIREALRNTHGVIIQTLWKEILSVKSQDFKNLMETPVVVDGRGGFSASSMSRAGVIFHRIGQGTSSED